MMSANGGGDRTPASGRERLLRRERNLRNAERGWFGLIAVVGFVAVLMSGVVVFASVPGGCGACHAKVAASQSAGSHAGLACEDCHAGLSVADVLEGRMAAIDMAAAYVVAPRTSIARPTHSERCMQCHQGILSQKVLVRGINMDHKAPQASGWECGACHPQAGHEIPTLSRGYTMDACLSCHTTNPGNLATCETCHVAETGLRRREGVSASPWQITHGPNWESVHGMGAINTCPACHASAVCARCHGANVPHAPTYLNKHGADVLSRTEGREKCVVCHQDGACDECHGLPMPHEPGFTKGHSAAIGADAGIIDSCVRCHRQRSCDDCHARHTHPGLTPERIKALRSRPVTVR